MGRVRRVLAVAFVPEVVLAHDTGHVHAPGAPLDGNAAVGAFLGVLQNTLVRRRVPFSGDEMCNIHLILKRCVDGVGSEPQ